MDTSPPEEDACRERGGWVPLSALLLPCSARSRSAHIMAATYLSSLNTALGLHNCDAWSPRALRCTLKRCLRPALTRAHRTPAQHDEQLCTSKVSELQVKNMR